MQIVMKNTEKAIPEPSMEEILTSIRTIISGEAKGGNPPSLKRGDILDLTDLLPDEKGNVASLKKSPANPTSLKKEKSVPFESRPAEEKKREGPHDDFFDYIKEGSAPSHQDPYSSSTFSQPSQALQTLKTLVQKNPGTFQSRHIKGDTPQTLENLVCDLFNPLVKEWLDANLPSLVQRVVNEHIERMMCQLDAASPPPEKQKSHSHG